MQPNMVPSTPEAISQLGDAIVFQHERVQIRQLPEACAYELMEHLNNEEPYACLRDKAACCPRGLQ